MVSYFIITTTWPAGDSGGMPAGVWIVPHCTRGPDHAGQSGPANIAEPVRPAQPYNPIATPHQPSHCKDRQFPRPAPACGCTMALGDRKRHMY